MIDSEHIGHPENGLYELFWPNGRPKYRGQFCDGHEVGQHIRFFENGVLAQVCWYDDFGRPRGTTLTFYDDGNKDDEEVYEDDQRRPGTFVNKSYDAQGNVFLRTTYVEFRQLEMWERDPSELDPETQRIIDQSIADLERIVEDDDEEEE